MSLPAFDPQGTLLGSLASVGATLFADGDRFKLFAQKIWPHLAAARPILAECYRANNGRPALEPMVMLGVAIFQFLERTPWVRQWGQVSYLDRADHTSSRNALTEACQDITPDP